MFAVTKSVIFVGRFAWSYFICKVCCITTEQKASELVWSFYHRIEHVISDEYINSDFEIAKQCAIYCCDEIERSAVQFISTKAYWSAYWDEVRQMIVKL